MKETLLNLLQQRLFNKSTLKAVIIIGLCAWQREHLAMIVDEYIKTPEFRGVLFGWISSLVVWLIGKKD